MEARPNTAQRNDSPEYRFTFVFYLLVFVFWFCNFFGSSDYYGLLQYTGPIGILAVYLHKSAGFYSTMDLSILFLTIYYFRKFPVSVTYNKEYYGFFLISIFAVVFCVINPNNNWTLKGLLFDENWRVFYLYLLMLFVFLFMRGDALAAVLRRMLLLGGIMAVLLSMYSIVRLFYSPSVNFVGRYVTIVQADVLFWIAIFQTLAVLAFFSTQRKIYLLVAAIFFITLFLSFRRSALLISLAVVSVIFVLVILRSGRFFRTAKNIVLLSALFAIVLYYLNASKAINLEYYYLRYSAVLSIIGEPQAVVGDRFISDMGHGIESQRTTQYMMNNLDRFWGAGFGNNPFIVPGATNNGRYIHNSFVYVWSKFGLFMTLLLVYIMYFCVRRGLGLFFARTTAVSKDSHLFRLGIFCLIFAITANGYANPRVTFLLMDTLTISQFVLLISLTCLKGEEFLRFVGLKNA